jgi:O-antigen ligase
MMRTSVQIGFGTFFIACLLAAIWWQTGAVIVLPFALLFLMAAFYFPGAAWYLLIFSLPLSGEINFSEALGSDIPDEPVMMVMTVIFLFALLSGHLRNTAQLVKHPVFFLVTALWCWSVFSALFSTAPFISLKYILAKIWYIMPFMLMPFFLLKGKKEIRQLVIALLAAMGITVVYTLFRHAQQGFLFDNANHVVRPFFRNHVNYAAMLVCLLPALYFSARGVKNKQWTKYLYAGLLLFLAALFFSFSRGAWLALVTGLVAAAFIRVRLLPQAFVLAITGIIITAAWFANNNRYLNYHHNYKKTIYHENFSDHIQATFRNTDLSNAERIYRWIAAIRMGSERPLTGFGPGSFYQNYKPYGVSYFKTWVSNNPEHSTVHNYFLLLLAEQGMPALVLFCVLLWVLFARVQHLYHRLTDPFYRNAVMCTGVMLVMIVTVNMLSDLIETDKIGSLFYLCCGMVMVLERRVE